MEQLASPAGCKPGTRERKPGPLAGCFFVTKQMWLFFYATVCLRRSEKAHRSASLGCDGEPFVFFRGPQGTSHCSCLELILPFPCLITGSLCWCSIDAFRFLSSAWDNGCAGMELQPARSSQQQPGPGLAWSLQERDSPRLPTAAAG